MKHLFTVAMAALGLVGAAATATASDKEPPHLLVLGVMHFANPGRDMVNSQVEDVMSAKRQLEITRLVDALAATRPNHVAVELPASAQAELDKRYADYRAGRYTLTQNEVDQIGLRLAAKLNLPRVDAIDWNAKPPGSSDDYDFPKWLAAQGRMREFEALQGDTGKLVARLDGLNRCRPVADWLHDLNTPEYRAIDAAAYYRIATFGGATENPGAAWVGTWYARNLRIAAILRDIAGKPGDRTVAIFGAGHAGLLSQYSAGMGFKVDNTIAALPKMSRPYC